MNSALKPGDPAPDFDLPTAGGGRVSLASLRGKPAVLYFYPKDDTAGCTQEALNFTERAQDFARAGAAVVGVSPDSVAAHERFAKKHGLKVTLAADEGAQVAQRFGVWGEKTLYGRKYMGVERSTFLIGSNGRLMRIWRRVKLKGHVEEVLAALKD
jgi:peroxiredoxin Q/BCP